MSRRAPRPFSQGSSRVFASRPAAAAIVDVLRFRGIADEIRANRLLTEWSDLVGERIASRTRPDGVFERILHVEVATSAWLHELNLLRPQLLSSLLERFGEPRLFDELKFKLAGRSRRTSLAPRPVRRVAQPPPRPAPATEAAREAIIKDVEKIEDDELREIIAKVRISNAK